MIVTRIQLYCDRDCANFYPRSGALDGAIYTTSQLRGEAKRQGWQRREKKDGFGKVDICPTCAKAKETNL